MKYDIYFHNDFDGHTSAAVMLAFLRSRGDSIEHYVPMDFDLLEQWKREDFFAKHRFFKGKRNPAIVVDFPFHPKATFWFDHHESPFKAKGWEKKFMPGPYQHLYTDYPSCCRVVYDALRKSFGWKPPVHIKELVRWADIIDGAAYRSARQTLLFKESALQVDAFIDATPRNAKKSAKLIKLLSEKPIERIARMPNVRRAVAQVKRRTAKNLQFYKKNLKLIGRTSFIDVKNDPSLFLRYAPYHFFPKTQYAIRFSMKGPLFHIGIAWNPWKAFRKGVNIGMMMKRYGGGGHEKAGAADFVKLADAERALREMIKKLNA